MHAINTHKIEKISNFNEEKSNLAYIAGVSAIGMAYKMSIAPIDITDALFVEKEAIKMRKNYDIYFEKLTPEMLMNISISAINMSRNLDKYKPGVIKYKI